MADFQATLTEMQSLKHTAKGRDGRRRSWKLLRRNLDPRDHPVVTNDTTPEHMFDHASFGAKDALIHNDAGTFFILALHMLTHREPRWKAAIRENERENENSVRQKGISERHVESIMIQNDDRLVSAGKGRFSRHLMDPALETGTSVYYRNAHVEDGEIKFLIEPLDPNKVYVEFDRQGLSRLLYEDRRRIKDLIAEGKVNPNFNVSELKEKKDHNEFLSVYDYWERTFVRDAGVQVPREEIKHAIFIDESIEYLAFGISEAPEIPYKVHRYNGEAYPGQDSDDDKLDNIRGRGILAENERVYLEKHDFLTKLGAHLNKVINADTFDQTRGATPRLDPSKFLDEGKSTNTTYDIGEQGAQTVRLNPVDQSAQYLWLAMEAARQRGSVPDLLHGNLSIELSGFAISQVLESSEASIGTFNIVYKGLLKDLAQWIIETTKGLAELEEVQPVQIVGAAATTGTREHTFEEFNPTEDLPETTLMFVENDLAKPSDLTERITQARQLDPAGGALATRVTIWDNLLWDLVRDPHGEGNALVGQMLENLPEIQKIEFLGELGLRELTLREMGNDVAADAVRASMELIQQTLMQNANNQNMNDSGVSSGTRQEVMSTEQRTAGQGTGPVRSTTPPQQQAG